MVKRKFGQGQGSAMRHLFATTVLYFVENTTQSRVSSDKFYRYEFNVVSSFPSFLPEFTMAVITAPFLRSLGPRPVSKPIHFLGQVEPARRLRHCYHHRASQPPPMSPGAGHHHHHHHHYNRHHRSFREIKRWKENEGASGRGRRQQSTSVGGVVVGGMTLAAGGISAVIMAQV
jgi:hypothetical protein